jgi:hypothetical protein
MRRIHKLVKELVVRHPIGRTTRGRLAAAHPATRFPDSRGLILLKVSEGLSKSFRRSDQAELVMSFKQTAFPLDTFVLSEFQGGSLFLSKIPRTFLFPSTVRQAKISTTKNFF